ncbi:MAG: MobF family relaxase [Planctomycetota bacterium]|nr:MobF family relaxase [Planctomycetota bacterium]
MHQFRSQGQLTDYYTAALAGGDYSTADEQRSLWQGELAKRLGLPEEVTRESFLAMAENRHPVTGEPLTPRTDADRTVAYDINFHVPKSVSVLHMVAKDDRIIEAIRESVRETMKDIEKHAKTRVRIDGKQEERSTGELAWAEFVHPTTRPEDGIPDPHLHVHCLAFNATHDPEEERIKATQFREIKRNMPYFEAGFHSRLVWRLEDLGYRVRAEGKKWEIEGFTKELTDKYSRRTLAIEKKAKEQGITDPALKAELGAKTRSRKTNRWTADELHKEWMSWLSPEERKTVERAAKADYRPDRGSERAAARDGLARTVDHHFERNSIADEPRLREAALQGGLGKFRPEALDKAADAHPELLRRSENGQTVVTTRQVLAEEQRMLSFARDGRGSCAALEGDRPWQAPYANLNAEQRRAVEMLLRSRDRVMLVRGGAGTGKSTLLREFSKAVESRSGPVTVLASTAEASRGVLREAGFRDAETVATFLDKPEMQAKARGGVIWVDEAGLIGTPTTAKLFAMAEKLNARVVMCGDIKQHAPVERGDALRLLTTRIDLTAAELTTVVRQRGQYKEAVEDFSKGHFDRGIEKLDRMDAIRKVERNNWLPMVEDYLDKTRQNRSALIVAPTHAVGAEITTLIRASLKHEGKLGMEERLIPQLHDLRWSAAERGDASRYESGQVVQFFRTVGKGERGFRAGERLRVSGRNANGDVVVIGKDNRERTLPLNRAASFGVSEERVLRVAPGESLRAIGGGRTIDGKNRINNGAMFTLKGFTPEGHLRLSNGWVVSNDIGRFAHGYVSTSHASQGRTVDWVFIAQSRAAAPAASAEQMYVSVSRGRQGVRIYTDDRRALVDAVQRQSQRQAAVEPRRDFSGAERSQLHAQMLVRLRQYELVRSRAPSRARELGSFYDR